MELEETTMANKKRGRRARRTAKQAEAVGDQLSTSDIESVGERAHGGYGSEGQLESAMGGTSDAGTAADDAAEAAALNRGLPDDRTQGTSETFGARTSADQGTYGSFGGDVSAEGQPPTAFELDEPSESSPTERPDDWR
jgi:hypothetical protein